VCPSGIYRPLPGSAQPSQSQSFCCHIFSRAQLSLPIASVAGLEDAAVAVRFSPAVYRRIDPPAPPVEEPPTEGSEDPAAAAAAEGEGGGRVQFTGHIQGEFRYVLRSEWVGTVASIHLTRLELT
jgi:hypothetical protein